jgi:cyclopropane-fatty-acyl-phospholipid synthase
MSTTYQSTKTLNSSYPYTTKIFLAMMSKIQIGSLHLEMPEGEIRIFNGRKTGPNASLKIKDHSVIAKLFSSSDIALAEAYRDGLIETNDLTALMLMACLNQEILEKAFTGNFFGMIFYRLRHSLRFNSRRGSKKNIHAHYDLGNSFYELLLDPSMTYSSAIFKVQDESLESAQQNKYQRIIDSLQLKATDHILEIGCGWGGFAAMAAAQSGCRVTCLTLSNEQFAYSTELVKKLNLDHLVEIKICDYRDETGLFDHIVSIEMIEAVGSQYWDNYFSTLFARLKTGGKAHIQSITIKDEFFEAYKKSTDFIQQYIFPGGMVLAPKMIKSRALKNGFIVNDYFEFGLDYAETLRRWKEAFNQKIDLVKAVGFDENFIKIWIFYYSYCEAGFMSRRIDVAQVLLEKK